MSLFVSGGIAGVLGWLVTYPLDVIKSRIQTDSFRKPQYSGILDCIKKSHNQHGWRIFFKGLVTTLSRAFVVNGTTFVGYELSLSMLHNVHDKHFL
jgi:solute carrier family 25 carnitine/acylcarnitine transporter 20/29